MYGSCILEMGGANYDSINNEFGQEFQMENLYKNV